MSGSAITTAAAVVGMSVGAITLYGLSVRFYRRSFGRRRNVTSRLNQLACGTTVEHVEGLFGPPAFRKPLGEQRVERLYYTPYAWLQVIYDKTSDAVDAFAITVLDRRLAFRTGNLTFDGIDLRLGRERFSDVTASRSDSVYIQGARRYRYSEAYYFGNPGGYQWFIVSATLLGSACLGSSHDNWPPLGQWTTGRFRAGVDQQYLTHTPHDEPTDIAGHREFFVIDTLMVVGPGGGDDLIATWPGAESDLVRLLRPSGGTTWVHRRRMHRRIAKARRASSEQAHVRR